jgi:hypothetical protein
MVGDLRKQRAVRYATEADLDRHGCTIEECEEYEPYFEARIAVFAGVDYRAIIADAEKPCRRRAWGRRKQRLSVRAPDFRLLFWMRFGPVMKSATTRVKRTRVAFLS